MPAKLRRLPIALGAVLALAAAAYVGLSLHGPNGAGAGGPPLGAATRGTGKQPGVTFDVIRATEIPAANPDLVGQLQTRQDNSLMVLPATKGAPAPVVEVVVTTQTRLYRNATGDTPPSGTTVQMVVVPYTLDQVAAGDNIIAWGQRRGGRIVADVVLIEPQAANTALGSEPAGSTAQAP